MLFRSRTRKHILAYSCPTLCNPVDCIPPGSSIHGILQARILEWGAIAFSEQKLAAAIVSVWVFDLRPNYDGGNEDNGYLLQKEALGAPNPAAGHLHPMPLIETPGHSWASLGRLLWGHCSFLLGPGAHKVLFVSSKILFPQSCINLEAL